MDLASNVIDSSVECFGVEYYAKPSFVGQAAPPHQDNFYWKFLDGKGLTLWIALSRSETINGSLYFYPGSHLIGDLPHECSNVPGTSQQIPSSVLLNSKLNNPVNVTLNRGDCVIHHSRTIHGSSPNKSPYPRQGLAIRYKSVDETVDQNSLDQYFSALNNQLVTRGDNLSFLH